MVEGGDTNLPKGGSTYTLDEGEGQPGRGRSRRTRRYNAFSHFWLAGVAVLVSTGLIFAALVYWLREYSEADILQASGQTTTLYLEIELRKVAHDLASGTMLSDESLEILDDLTGKVGEDHPIVLLKIWDGTGRLVYTSRPQKTADPMSRSDLGAVLAGKTISHVADEDETDHMGSHVSAARMFEVYSPLFDTANDAVVGVIEIYHSMGSIGQALQSSLLRSWVAFGGAIAVMIASVLVLSWRSSVVIDRQRGEIEDRMEREIEMNRERLVLVRERADAMRTANSIDEMRQANIGADLHDGAAQLLAFVLLKLGQIRARLDPQRDPKSTSEIDQIMDAAEQSLSDVRLVSEGLLLPQTAMNGDFAEALREVNRIVERRSEKKVDLTVTNVPATLPRYIMSTVIRIVQEALSNSVRHADGNGMTVSVSCDDDWLLLRISDTGPSENGEASRPGREGSGLGMHTMRYRTLALGGEFSVTDLDPGRLIECRLPLESGGQTGDGFLPVFDTDG